MESDVRIKLAEIILVWSDAETLKECYELADAILERFCVGEHMFNDPSYEYTGKCHECGKEKSK